MDGLGLTPKGKRDLRWRVAEPGRSGGPPGEESPASTPPGGDPVSCQGLLPQPGGLPRGRRLAGADRLLDAVPHGAPVVLAPAVLLAERLPPDRVALGVAALAGLALDEANALPLALEAELLPAAVLALLLGGRRNGLWSGKRRLEALVEAVERIVAGPVELGIEEPMESVKVPVGVVMVASYGPTRAILRAAAPELSPIVRTVKNSETGASARSCRGCQWSQCPLRDRPGNRS